MAGTGPSTYTAIADALERDVAAGALREGDRLPPHRKLARALGVAVGTVTRAYAEAEARGLVRGEVGRGTFVGGRSAGGRPPGARAPGAYDLAVTWPLHALDPDLGAALRRLSQRADVGELLRYPPPAGLPHHRAAGALWAREHGMAVEDDRVLVCAGVQHALSVALATVAAPGDVVATEAFTYPAFKALAAVGRLRLAGVAMDAEGMLPEDFEAVCRTHRPRALYTVPTLQNPTAGVLGEARRRAIAEIAARHGVTIVEDDVHRLLHPDPPPAFGALAPEVTCTVVSLSKVVTGALRTAYLVAPRGLVERLSHAVWATAWAAAPLTAEVAAAWIEDGTAAATMRRKRREAAARQEIARSLLAGCTFRTAPHAYHLWLELPEGWGGSDFALAAARRGVLVTPGEAFATDRGTGAGAVRVSLTGTDTREELR
ncbi:MAG TPA: PLP-dependent aminotransferase family protein, partial [Longimicrobiaceae bacterium]|nr:PLP-dependent aminotransferase family protein [Longimicrobiaceae bacterium]